MQHTFFVHFFAVVLHDCNVKLPETFLWRKCRTCSRSLFFTAAHFHLAFDWWPLAFLIFLSPLQNYDVVLPTKKCLLFLNSRSRSLSHYFLLSFADLPPTFSFLCLSFALYSKFVDMTVNLSLIL